MTLTFDHEFTDAVNGYRAIIIEANVANSPTSPEQRDEMARLACDIAARHRISDINRIPAIAATRAAYKSCGKDPNRYRPSQEQMMRRIVRGLGLYHVNALVDAGNQLSLVTGCSVGCFDADRIEGTSLTLGVGKPGEPYEGIGRGTLNIEGMPVFRDAAGGFGTPTSDNERTKISLDTRRLLVTIHLFDPAIDATRVIDTFTDLFTRHAQATDIRYHIHPA